MTTNEKLRNTTIRHAHFIEQYKNDEVQKIIAMLNKTDASLRTQLLKYKGKTPTITSKRLALMRKDIKDIVEDSKLILKNKLEGTAVQFGNMESKWLGDIIKDAVPGEVPISFIQPSPTQILAAIKARPFNNETLQGMIDGWALTKKNTLINAVQQAFVQGQSIDDAVKTLFGTKALQYTDALIDGSRRQIRTQIRTALNHFSSVSREITYKANADLIKGVQWVSTLDGRTTLQCINLDGKIDYDDGSVRELNGLRPPAHYNCRSTTVPVIKSLKELGLSDKEFRPSTRASMNGQVPETMRYKDWFAKQDEKFQRQVLGAKKYDLWKSGQFTFDKFVDNGTTLNLNQLSMIDNINVPSVPPFVEAKTIDEAEKWAIDTLGISSASYKGANIDVVNEMNKSIYDNFTKFPKLKETFRDIGTSQNMREVFAKRFADAIYPTLSDYERRRIGYSGLISEAKRRFGNVSSKNWASSFEYNIKSKNIPLLNGVGVNAKYAKNPTLWKSDLKYCVASKYHPIGCDTIKSVIDHEMGHELDKLLGRLSSTEKFINVTKKYNIAKDLSGYPMTYTKKYISSRYREVLAEGWSEYLNNLTPRPFAKEIGDMIIDEYKNKFGGL